MPPALASEQVYVFKGSTGYDGQFYHYIAHDPLLRQGFGDYIDAPRLRYRRILVPGLAYVLAAGQSRYIDTAYLAVTLGLVFLGAYWLSVLTGRLFQQPAWGVAFLLAPGVLVSIDRLTVDLALAALCVGFAAYARNGPVWKLYVVVAAAGLARETGLLLIGACCLAAMLQGKWRRAVVLGTAGVPTAAWYAYVGAVTPAASKVGFSWIPLHGWLYRLPHPPSYPLAGPALWLAHGLDYVALAGVLVALAVVARLAFRQKPGAVEMAAALFGMLALFLGPGDTWDTAYGFGRSLAPLLLLPALAGLERRLWVALLPAAMVAPRVVLQLGPQALGIVRGLAGLA